MNAQIQRSPQMPDHRKVRIGSTEVLDICYYDTLLYGAGQTLEAENKLFTDSNRINKADLCNLKLQGHLTDNRMLTIWSCSLIVWSQGSPAFYELAVNFSRFHFQIDESNKQMLWGYQLAAPGGVTGFNSAPGGFNLNNGDGSSEAGYSFREPIKIYPETSFEITHKMQSKFEGAFDPRALINAEDTDVRMMRFQMRGIEGRNPY